MIVLLIKDKDTADNLERLLGSVGLHALDMGPKAYVNGHIKQTYEVTYIPPLLRADKGVRSGD